MGQTCFGFCCWSGVTSVPSYAFGQHFLGNRLALGYQRTIGEVFFCNAVTLETLEDFADCYAGNQRQVIAEEEENETLWTDSKACGIFHFLR